MIPAKARKFGWVGGAGEGLFREGRHKFQEGLSCPTPVTVIWADIHYSVAGSPQL